MKKKRQFVLNAVIYLKATILFVQSAGLKEKPCKHEDKAVAVTTATALIYVKLIDFTGNKNKDGCKKGFTVRTLWQTIIIRVRLARNQNADIFDDFW